MKKSKNITTLEELRAQKRKLELEGKVTKREFAHSIGSMNSNLKDVLLTKVAIPVGIAGIVAYGVKKAMEYRARQEENAAADFKVQQKATVDANATSNKERTNTAPKREENISTSFSSKSSKTSSNLQETPEYKTTKSYTQNNIMGTPEKVVVKKPRHIELKKWLPVAIQVAKSGWTFYQQNYVNNEASTISQKVNNNGQKEYHHTDNSYHKTSET